MKEERRGKRQEEKNEMDWIECIEEKKIKRMNKGILFSVGRINNMAVQDILLLRKLAEKARQHHFK